MKLLRLDKVLADNTAYSRKEVAKLIKQRLVLVDGEVATNPSQKVSEDAILEVAGEDVETSSGIDFLILHKPAGYVCTHEDPSYPTIFDLLPEQYRRFQAIGRLDLDTTGLIFLTSDGKVNHRLTSPKKDIPKTYFVTLADPIEDFYADEVASGMQLKGEKQPCKTAELEIIDDYHCLLTIYEGRYHQVKRMFGALGNKVENLHRCKIGNFDLENSPVPLDEGEFYETTFTEILPLIIKD